MLTLNTFQCKKKCLRALRARRAGAALLIVLAFLVLMTVLTVAFFSSVTGQTTLANAHANSSSVIQLANAGVNIVMAQIVDATSTASPTTGPRAWASQPGLIRTFSASGSDATSYKLYSSDKMTETGPVNDLPPANWNAATNAGSYYDLNAPILVEDTKGAITSNAKTFSAVYPIVDPLAQGLVDGFSVATPPGYNGANPPNAASDPTTNLLPNTAGTTSNPAPMPVKWLYVLKSGSLAPVTSVSHGTAIVASASRTDPIVGRVAFWTDDETCKVNVNTASEGTYWDVPTIYSKEEFGSWVFSLASFSTSQPIQHEFQRYPGHPATTCLSPIFGGPNWNPPLLPVTYPYPPNPVSADSAKLDPYYKLAPRIGKSDGTGGGSNGGSSQAVATAVITTDSDRLYASVDELMFTPTLSGSLRIPNTSDSAQPKAITKDVLEKTRFFITANSAAPETTLFNTPRIAVWPVATGSNQRTAYDSLLAFCSTIGGKEYYFTRTPLTGARSSTADFGPRNQTLYSYLQKLTSLEVPGFGGNFLAKYGAGAGGVTDRDQILTCIYDYIRCTNLQDHSTGATGYTPTYSFYATGAGEVIPIRIGGTQGFGRFLGISSANLLFYATGTNAAGNTTAMRALFFLQFDTPQLGFGAMRSKTKYTVAGLNQLRVKFQGAASDLSMNLPSGGTNHLNRMSDLGTSGGRDLGGSEGPQQALYTTVKPWPDSASGQDSVNTGCYPFFSAADMPVPAGATTFSIPSDAQVVVNIDPEEATSTSGSIQVVHLTFPSTGSGSIKVPSAPTPLVPNIGSRDFYGGAWFSNNDSIVSLEVAGAGGNAPGPGSDSSAGDHRMTGALMNVPAERFRSHQNYTSPAVQSAHSLSTSTGIRLPLYVTSGTFGVLAPGANYYQTLVGFWRQPDIPSRVPLSTGVTRADSGPGDWDTGVGDQRDGAYINKPDEGDSLTAALGGRLPYAPGSMAGYASATNIYFSPNRQIPSPLMFGSLPTGIQRFKPWQTLLFHPRPEDPGHPGNQSPKDHLLADLFWMPVVEPYAISQPFATNGKINLNYQILPFTYIQRSTGIHAVMRSTKFSAIPVADASTYKPTDAWYYAPNKPPNNPNRKRSIDVSKTLADFEAKFTSNQVFKSASQICEINLLPLNEPGVNSSADMASFWNANRLTGDNLRERPYVNLYSRLTTKSNTYTVHVCAQLLKKVPGTAPGSFFDPDGSASGPKDQILSEYRGSAIIERYIDLNDPKLPDFAGLFSVDPSDPALNMNQYYKFRVVSQKRFDP